MSLNFGGITMYRQLTGIAPYKDGSAIFFKITS
ncbi:unnamed protein product [Thelazia callipaeda]|uniref:Phage tail protein n=1 Tax=Thelazia callipaeda TaxID=103827 RepID=A0A0N5CTH4_THECL|nr:unnamed protein product [Thelazia callipaeda]